MLNSKMRVTVNGTEQEVPADTNVSQLLARLNILPERISVEINLDVISREAYDHSHLKDGDQIEIISFFGGGADVG
jgi:thiamine biosynthesis protein ThiS